MVKIKYIGKHQPAEIKDVSEEKAKILIQSEDYIKLDGDVNSKKDINTSKGIKSSSSISDKGKPKKVAESKPSDTS